MKFEEWIQYEKARLAEKEAQRAQKSTDVIDGSKLTIGELMAMARLWAEQQGNTLWWEPGSHDRKRHNGARPT